MDKKVIEGILHFHGGHLLIVDDKDDAGYLESYVIRQLSDDDLGKRVRITIEEAPDGKG